ncbi:MAG TPA: hypothetical protein VHY37_09390 [Tepidisphaeraceae bacterium]|jgi:hypothetical protein|nr:hypothetical protein [Tepidisphaeraceae bacterium]
MSLGKGSIQRKCCGTLGRRLLECVAMMMIGDGLLAAIDPKRHMKLWEQGPHLWERIMQPWVKRPELTRWLGAAELVAGICLAQQLQPDSSEEDS